VVRRRRAAVPVDEGGGASDRRGEAACETCLGFGGGQEGELQRPSHLHLLPFEDSRGAVAEKGFGSAEKRLGSGDGRRAVHGRERGDVACGRRREEL
jgi:hypothetical protein